MSMEIGGRALEILVVEDNPGDARLVQEVWKEVGGGVRLTAVRNGEEALASLRRGDGTSRGRPPDLILLDLNLPRMDGRELLAVLKQDPALRRVPVIVLTTSRAEEDVARSYDLHANCYIVKPVGLEELFRQLRAIHEFWFSVVRLP